MIYTLTLNPCLDYVMECEKAVFGETNRSVKESISFGGKGINVSYVLNELGEKSKAIGFVGGFTGNELEKMLDKAKIEHDFVHVKSGDTRINVKLKGKEITEINASGFEVTDGDMQDLYQKLSCLTSGDMLVIGGSAPKGSPKDVYENICKLLSPKGIKLVVDTTGEKLLCCLKYKPFLVKPNKQELAEIAGFEINADGDAVRGAKMLQSMGAINVLVSMSGDGALLVDENEKVHKVKAHKITAVNTVGAGDSMVAGFLCGADKGYEYALKLGNACGAATAMSEGLASIGNIKSLLTENN